MADKIVSWGGIESKSTSGISVTGSLSAVGSGSFGYGNIASGNTYIKIDPNQINSRITFNDFDGGIGSRGGELEMGTYDSRLTYGSYNWFYIGNSSYKYLFYIGDNRRILISEASSKPTNTTAMLTVKGTGTTSSTTSFLVQDSSGNTSLQVKDDKTTTFGAPIYLSGNQGYIYYGAGDYIQFPRQGGPAPGYFSTSTAGDGWAFRLASNSQTYARIMEGSFYLEAYTPNSNGRNSIKTWFSGSNFVYIDGDGAAGNAPAYGNGVNVIIRGGKSGTYSNIDSRGTAGYVTVEGGSAFSGSSTTHVAAAGVNIQTGLGLGSGSAADLTFSTSTTSSVASTYHTQTQRMIIKGQTGNIGIGTSVPSASLHISGSSNSALFEVDSPAVNNILYVSGSGNVGIGTSTPTSTLHVKGLTTVYASSSFKVENSTTSGSFKVTDTGKLFLAVNNSSGYNEPQATNSASMYIHEGPSNSGRAGITLHSGASTGNGSYLHFFNYISHWASGIQHYSAGGGGIQKMRFYIGYDASQQLGDGGNIMTISSNGLGINTLAAEISAILQVKGSGTTSSTTALLVQNSAATENFRIYDNGNITIGLGTTTFSSIGGNGSAPSSSIYFDNYPNNHQVHHQIINRAAGQGSPYNYLKFPSAYNGTYEFIGAGGGVTLALSNSGSTAFMNYNHNGITTNSSNIPITIDPSARTLTYGGGSNDVNHLAPYQVILKGNRPLSSGLDAGGDVYILGGLPRSGSSGISGSIYLTGGTINAQNTLYISGSRVGIGTSTPSASLHVSGAILNYPITLPTASGTASMDCSKSNFFNLTLSGSYTLFLSASNIQPGQTINLRVIQPATSGSLNYGSQFKFAGGIPYSASATSSTVDIISFISYDTAVLYGSAIKNLS